MKNSKRSVTRLLYLALPLALALGLAVLLNLLVTPARADADGSWSEVNTGITTTTGILYDVWGSSSSDVFAVGYDYSGMGSNGGLILHYDGSSWVTMTTSITTTNGYLMGVWGSSGNDVFAVGQNGMGGNGGLILHYDGSSWVTMTTGITTTSYGYLQDVWGSSGSDVFAVGISDSGIGTNGGLILHYDGSSWVTMTTGITTTYSTGLNAIWGSSASDVFAVGGNYGGMGDGEAIILHYDGSSWVTMTTGITTSQTLLGVWGYSSNDVYAVGGNYGMMGGDNGVIILHYDGNTWSQVPTGLPQSDYGVLYDVWGSSDSNVFAVGFDYSGTGTNGGLILHYDGDNWITMTTGITTTGYGYLLGVWGSSGNDVYAVGQGDSGMGGPEPLILHYGDPVNLELTKSVSPASARPGETITYTIAFNNSGTLTATHVMITDTLSANLTDVSYTSSGVALTQAPGPEYAWSAPDLLQNEGGVITITGVLVKPLAAGIFTNTVTLAASGVVETAEVPLTVLNVAPLADAGPDQSQLPNTAVTLDGSGSSDDNGDNLTYGWVQTDGPPVVLSSATTANPSFIAPGTPTELTFSLTVTDTHGLASTTPDEVLVSVGTPGYSSYPVAGSSINFGTLGIGTSVESNLTISETGNAMLIVNSLVLSGTNAADFSISTTSFSIADGGAAQVVTIACTPSGGGERTATLTVTHNAAGSPVTYTLTCTGVYILYVPTAFNNVGAP